ncbi:hypothetical protein ACVMB2_004594 [Sinorhizobium meliloti]
MVKASERAIAQSGFIRLEAKQAISAVKKREGTKPRPAHRQPEEDRRRQDEEDAADGDRPHRLAVNARRLNEDDQAEQDQHGGEHQREIAGAHAEGGAELEPERLPGEE